MCDTDEGDDHDGGNPTEQEQLRAWLQATVVGHYQLVAQRHRPTLGELVPVVREEARRHERRRAEKHDRVAEAGAVCGSETLFTS